MGSVWPKRRSVGPTSSSNNSLPMIDFELKNAHPKYRDLIVSVMENLVQLFPAASLKRVVVYPQESAKNCETCINRSLGDATEPGTIRLNSFWFGQSPQMLHAAGEVDDYVPNVPKLRWHGGLPQPGQVLVHEFFHVLYDGLGAPAKTFSREMWSKATNDQQVAFSGYSLYNPSEWWAENGAGLVLGAYHHSQVKELGDFLEKSFAKDDLPPFDPSKHPRGPDGQFRRGH